MKFSDRLKEFRKQNNLTQQELADKLFVSRSAIAKWEQDRGLPSVDTLNEISSILGVSVDDLISENEIRSITIDNNNKILSQKFNVKILFSILLALIIATTALFSIFIFGNKAEQPKEYTAEAFTTAVVEDNILTLDNYKAPFVFHAQVDLNDRSIEYLDKYGYPSSLTNIKTGYKLKFSYTYFEDKNGYRSFGKVKGIYLIDDYQHDELITKGFFLSTQEYTGDVVPINCPYFDDYNYDGAKYVLNGTEYGSEYKYPYFLMGDKNMSYARLLDVVVDGEEISRSPYTDQVIRENFALSIDVSNTVETIYVYAVDNSEKGYREYHRFTKTDFTHLEGQILHINWYNADHHAYKTEANINIYVHFVAANSIVLDEFNKSLELVKSTHIYTYEQANSMPYFLTEDGVRFVSVAVPGTGGGAIFAVGDTFDLYLPTMYGYMQTCPIKLL